MLDLILKYHKRKLNNMIEKGYNYDKTLKQSQKVDKYINRKMKELL